MTEEKNNFDWDRDTWKVIDNFFAQPEILVRHQLDSFNRFIDYDIPEIIQHHNPIEVGVNWDSNLKQYARKYTVRFGQIYLSKPLVLERNESIKVLLPNEARTRDLTYAAPLFVDVEHTLEISNAAGPPTIETSKLTKVPLAKIPIMLHSNYCYLSQASKNNKTLAELGEGEFDQGGYFVINGSEKVIIGIERPAENKVLCFKNKTSTKYSATTEIKSTRDQRLYPIKVVTVNLTKEPSLKDAKNKESGFGRTIKVGIQSLKVDIPLFVVFRALGIVTDREIFQMILYNMDDPDSNFVNLLLPSAEESLHVRDPEDKTQYLAIRTEEAALAYMSNAKVLKYDTSFLAKAEDKDAARRKYIKDLLARELFPHMGENNRKKAYFLGYMTRRLLQCFLGIRPYDDRDHYANKRVDLAGPLLSKIFSANFTRLVRKLKGDIQKHLGSDVEVKGTFPGLRKAIQSCSIETSLKYALSTGNWSTSKSGNAGATSKGVAQVLQRMSFIQTLSHLRRIQSPLERTGSKLVPPRKLHETQIGIICPNETPEGAQVGVVKNLAFQAHITQHSNPARVFMILRELGVRPLEEIYTGELLGATKVFVNGHFFGIIREGLTKKIYDNLKLLKKNSVGFDPYYSIRWFIEYRELTIQTDGGRYCRPLYVVTRNPKKEMVPTLLVEEVWDQIKPKLESGAMQWQDFLGPTWQDENPGDDPCNSDNHLIPENSALIEYLDTDETEGAMIAINNFILKNNRAIDGLKITKSGTGYTRGDKLVFDNGGTNGSDAAGFVSKVSEVDGKILQVRMTNRGRDYLRMPRISVQSAGGSGSEIQGVAKNQYLNYTHCEIHPMMWFGVVAQMIPFSEHNPSPRNVYQSSMGKQAIGVFATNYNSRMDTMAHVLCYPQKPLVMNRTMQYTNMDKLPSGMQTIVAISTWTGYNMEDSVIINQSAIDRGLFGSLAWKTYKDKEQKHKSVTSMNGMETFGIPDRELTKDMRGKPEDYEALDPETGIARVGSYVAGGDIIIGKYIELRPEDKEKSGKIYKDISKELKHNDDGYVDKVLNGKTGVINYNADGEKIAKVRVNQLRTPEIGDKFASRHAQKGTCGMLYRQEDMPVTESGMVPDIVLNPHCLTGDSSISVKAGYAKKLKDFSNQGGEKLWAWDENKKHFVVSTSAGLEAKGKKKVYKVCLEDGRSIRCTGDHKLLTFNNEGNYEWVEAQNINGKRVVCGLEMPTDNPAEDINSTWKLKTVEYDFDLTNPHNREKSLAFARILGYVLTDGCVSERADLKHGYASVVSMGHQIDALGLIDDIELITGKRPSYPYNKGVYAVRLPAPLSGAIGNLPGVQSGKRVDQTTTLPEFIMDSNCPKSIIREFLGGLFGGDGCAPHMIDRKNIDNGATFLIPGGFIQTCKEGFQDDLYKKMYCLKKIIEDQGVEVSRIEGPVLIIHRETGYTPVDGIPRYKVRLHLTNSSAFPLKIGIRYCIQKLCRFSAALTYQRLREKIIEQHSWVTQRTNYLYESAKNKNNKTSLAVALNMARIELKKNGPVLNEHYSLSSLKDIHNRRSRGGSTKKLTTIRYKNGMPDFTQWLKRIDCLSWFTRISATPEYITMQDSFDVPGFKLKVIGIYEDGEEETYDIGVNNQHSFLANGITVHNCMPSRMTVGQLLENLCGKVAALKGEIMDSTPFTAFSQSHVENILRSYGFEKNCDEVMYNGQTGQMLHIPIFIGPTYYQRLKHMVSDKIHSRENGPVQLMTRQPQEGRARDGGLRLGEMERDVLIAHGCSQFLKERLMESSDLFRVYVSKKDQAMVVANPEKNFFMYNGKHLTRDEVVEVQLPYAMKLLLHEMGAMGVDTRIVTD